MVEYRCRRCGYITCQKANFRKHLQRKNPCKVLHEDVPLSTMVEALGAEPSGYACDYCHSVFKTAQLKYQHKQRCKNNMFENKITELEERMAASTKQTTSTNITNNIQNIQNNIQINIRDFGHEDISYLPSHFISRCFVNKDLVALIENIHCDKEHKENHNVRIKSLKRDLMETRVDGRWILTDSDDTLTELIKNGYRVLMMHSRKHKNEIVEDELDEDIDEFERLRDWLDIVHDNKNEQAPIKRKLLLLFMNNKALLLEKETGD